MANLLVSKKLNKESMRLLAEKKDADFAILYKGALKEFVPDEWVEVGLWHDPGFCAGGDRNIHFLVIDLDKKQEFIRLLDSFSKTELKELIYNIYQ